MAWRRGDRRQALVVGGSIVFFALGGTLEAVLVLGGIIHAPLTASLFYLGLIAAMGYQLSDDVLRAARLSDELREREQQMARGRGTVPPSGGSLAQRNRVGERRRPGGAGQRGDREALRLHTRGIDGTARRDAGAGTVSRRSPWPPGGISRRSARTRHGPRTGALRPPQGRDGVHRRNRIEPGSARRRAARPGRHRGRHGPQAGRGRNAATARRAGPCRSHVHHGPAGDGPGARVEPAARGHPAQCGGRRAPAGEEPAGPGGGARHPRRHLQGRPPRGRGHRSHAGLCSSGAAWNASSSTSRS